MNGFVRRTHTPPCLTPTTHRGGALLGRLLSRNLPLPYFSYSPPPGHQACPVRNCQHTHDSRGHHRAAYIAKLDGCRQQINENTRDWLIFQFRAACLAASHQDIPHHNDGADSDGRGMHGDIIKNGRGGIFGYDTVIDVSRPHTHNGAGHIKPTALQACAGIKYTKHHRGYKALGIGFFPFVVDTLGRPHDDVLRIIWHLALRQIARNYKRRGWQARGRKMCE